MYILMKLATSSGLESSQMLSQVKEEHFIDYLGTGKLGRVSSL